MAISCHWLYMKIRFYLAFFLGAVFQLNAQNLVPNWSFEDVGTIPGSGHITAAADWFSPNTATPDLFNVNVPLSAFVVGVPGNYMGNQHPRTGNGYAGIVTVSDQNYSEYVEVALLSPLKKDQSYCVSFYVSLGDVAGYANSNIGAYFSVSNLQRTGTIPIDDVIPQVLNPPQAMLTDTADWMLVSGTYKATGGELYMTLGTFATKSNSNFIAISGKPTPNGLYYIDDVSVTECPEPPQQQPEPEQTGSVIVPNVFTPNNDGINDAFKIATKNIESLNCSVYNRWGSLVGNLNSPDDTWDGKNNAGKACEDGVYYFVLTAKGKDEKAYTQSGYITLFR